MIFPISCGSSSHMGGDTVLAVTQASDWSLLLNIPFLDLEDGVVWRKSALHLAGTQTQGLFNYCRKGAVVLLALGLNIQTWKVSPGGCTGG